MDTLVRWECQKCGHVYNGMVPPSECPNCGSSREQFSRIDGAPVGNVFVAEEHIPRHVKHWECDSCGRVLLTNELPDACPNCGASKDHFQPMKADL